MALGQLIPDGTTLTSLENVLFASGRKWGGFLYTEARDVFMVAALLMVAWHVIRIGLASGEGQMFSVFSEVLEKLLVIALVSAMFIKGTTFVDYVVTAGNGLATASGGNNAFDAIFGQMGKAIITMWDAWTQMPLWEMSDPLSMGALTKKVVSAVMILIASLLVLVIGAILIFTMLSGSFILAFAMASGPLVWAFALLPPTSFMVNGWLKLLATGFFTKLVAVLCIDMAVSAVTAAIGPANMPTGAAFWIEPVNIFANLAQMLVLLLLVALLVLFARGMASQLVSGNPSTDLWKSATGAAAAASQFASRLNSGAGAQSSGSKGGSKGGGSGSSTGNSSGAGTGAGSSGGGGASGGSASSGPPTMNAHSPSGAAANGGSGAEGPAHNPSAGQSRSDAAALAGFASVGVNSSSSSDQRASTTRSPLEESRDGTTASNSSTPRNDLAGSTSAAPAAVEPQSALSQVQSAPDSQAARTDGTNPQSPLDADANRTPSGEGPQERPTATEPDPNANANSTDSRLGDAQQGNQSVGNNNTADGPPHSFIAQSTSRQIGESEGSARPHAETSGKQPSVTEPAGSLANQQQPPPANPSKPDGLK